MVDLTAPVIGSSIDADAGATHASAGPVSAGVQTSKILGEAITGLGAFR